jgi:hypothetical protein
MHLVEFETHQGDKAFINRDAVRDLGGVAGPGNTLITFEKGHHVAVKGRYRAHRAKKFNTGS